MNPVRVEEHVRQASQGALSWTPRRPAVPRKVLLWIARLEAFWRYPLLKFKAAHAALLLSIAAICALRAWIGLTGVQVFTADAFMPLDGAWRMLNGQRPHLDFYSFMGVLVYVPTFVGLLLSHGGAEGFGYGQALVGALSGLAGYLLTRKRLPDVPAALFCESIVLLTTAPFPLGHSPLFTSPATTYNREGYAALALILLEAIAPAKPLRKWQEFLGGFLTGSLLVMLFFSKITFFGAAVFLIGALAFCRPQTAGRWTGIAAGCAALLFSFSAYFGFNLMPMLRDLAMVAGAKHVYPRAYHLDTILADAGTLISFAAIAALLLLLQQRSHSARAVVIAGASVCFAGAVLIFGSSEPHGAPLALFFVLLAIGQLTFRSQAEARLLSGAVLLWGTVITLTAITPSIIGFGYAAFLRVQATRHETPISGTNLADFTPTGTDAWYRKFVSDGLALVGQNRKPGDTLMCLDFTNPFSYGLGMKPAHGGATTLDYQTTFSDAYHPSPEWLIGSASLVMVPKTYSQPAYGNILRIYGPYLTSHFHLTAESRLWRLYRSN